jgi:hypothetical protein
MTDYYDSDYDSDCYCDIDYYDQYDKFNKNELSNFAYNSDDYDDDDNEDHYKNKKIIKKESNDKEEVEVENFFTMKGLKYDY